MSAVLLDTNIVSYILKRDTRATAYAPHLKGKILTVSFMTVGELYQWAYSRNWGKQRIGLMESELQKYFVFPFDIETCRIWGEIRANCQKMGRPISAQDAWIAATARQYKLSLITHNPDHFLVVADLEILTA